MRTDRKTGEPILSPRLSADQLHAMANDPGWRPWMRLIAEHPNAWPGLVDWWRTAQEQGFDTAGAAPEPPESMRGRRRVAIPAAPLPPENGAEPEAADPDGATDGWESVPLASEDGLAADPAPGHTAAPDRNRTSAAAWAAIPGRKAPSSARTRGARKIAAPATAIRSVPRRQKSISKKTNNPAATVCDPPSIPKAPPLHLYAAPVLSIR